MSEREYASDTRVNEPRATEPGHATGEGTRMDRSWLAHPLLGRDVRRTTALLSSLLALAVLFAVRRAGSAVRVEGAPLETHVIAFDGLSALLILAVTATLLVVPIGYALWNGGPGLAFVAPQVPIALGALASRSYVLDLDAAVALTTGAAGAALALYVGDVRRIEALADVDRTEALRPWRTRPIDEDVLLFVTAVAGLAFVVAVEFATTVPTYVLERFAPIAILFAIPVVVLAVYWRARFDVVRSDATRRVSDR